MRLDNVYYLPSEILSVQNYPIASQLWEDVEAITQYAGKALSALYNYNEKRSDKIDVAIAELLKYIALSRQTCQALSEASNVPYDLILELRRIQVLLQKIYHTYISFGSRYIGSSIVKGDEEA